MGTADGQQYMAGIQRPGRAGRTGGCRDPVGVQQKQQAFSFDPFKAQAYIAGQPPGSVSVEGAVGNPGEGVDQGLPQTEQVCGFGFSVPDSFFQGSRHGQYGRQIFRAGPFSPFLCAAADQGVGHDPPLHQQCADPFWTVEFVGGQGQHVDLVPGEIDVQNPGSLYRVRVEQDFLFGTDLSDFPDGLDGADFVIGVHDGDQRRFRGDGFPQLFRPDKTVFVYIQQRYPDVLLFFQQLQGVQYGVMLKFGGDHVVFSLLQSGHDSSADRLVIGFAAAGGEVDLPGIAVQQGSHPCSGVLQGGFGCLSGQVQTGGIPPKGSGGFCIRTQSVFTHAGRGSIVSVDH